MFHRNRAFCTSILLVLLALEIMFISAEDSVWISGFSILPAAVRKNTYFDKSRRLHVPENTIMAILVSGNFTSDTFLSLTKEKECNTSETSEAKLQVLEGSNGKVAEVTVKMPEATDGKIVIYLCLREGSWEIAKLQGVYGVGGSIHPWLTFGLVRQQLPLWLKIIFVILLLSLSALFSGLNLGLLSLDKTDLKVIINTGSQREKSEALKIAPVRNHGNFLLCSLLFSNVLVNTIFTLIMDTIFGGDWETVVVTTLTVVIFGEIAPQAVCSRYGLTVGAKTIWVTKFFMVLSFPVSYPVGKLLDGMLGEEVGAVYTRDRLKELLKVTMDQHGLESEEIGIIAGTLDMKSKTVKDIMTPISDIYMLSSDATLNLKLLTDIEQRGFTRIPVYQGERWNVIGVLNVKQLAVLDPDQHVTVKAQVDHNKSHVFCVFENTRLDYMLKAFKEGSRGHMAFVQRVNDEGPGDPKYETIGLVTMEDVLEELLQAEIYDENDVERQQIKILQHNPQPPSTHSGLQ